jgi:hypothetical protein
VRAARVIWITWCLAWTLLWSLAALEAAGTGHAGTRLGLTAAAVSAAAILLPVGGPSPKWVRELWDTRPSEQYRRYLDRDR